MKQILIFIFIFFAGCIPFTWLTKIPKEDMKCQILKKGIDLSGCQCGKKQFQIKTPYYTNYIDVSDKTYTNHKVGDILLLNLPIEEETVIHVIKVLFGYLGLIITLIWIFGFLIRHCDD